MRNSHRNVAGLLVATALALTVAPASAQDTRIGPTIEYMGRMADGATGKSFRASVGLAMVGDGARVTGVLQTDGPLPTSSSLNGRRTGLRCELAGKTMEGYRLVMVGHCDDLRFEAEYQINAPGRPLRGSVSLMRR